MQTGNSVSPLDKTYHGGPRTANYSWRHFHGRPAFHSLVQARDVGVSRSAFQPSRANRTESVFRTEDIQRKVRSQTCAQSAMSAVDVRTHLKASCANSSQPSPQIRPPRQGMQSRALSRKVVSIKDVSLLRVDDHGNLNSNSGAFANSS